LFFTEKWFSNCSFSHVTHCIDETWYNIVYVFFLDNNCTWLSVLTFKISTYLRISDGLTDLSALKYLHMTLYWKQWLLSVCLSFSVFVTLWCWNCSSTWNQSWIWTIHVQLMYFWLDVCYWGCALLFFFNHRKQGPSRTFASVGAWRRRRRPWKSWIGRGRKSTGLSRTRSECFPPACIALSERR
jgi:hypothetical protein